MEVIICSVSNKRAEMFCNKPQIKLNQGWSKHQLCNWTWAPPWFANLHTRQLQILQTQVTQYTSKMHQLQNMSGCSDAVSWWNDDNATIGTQPPQWQLFTLTHSPRIREIVPLLRHCTPSEELYQEEMLSARYVSGRWTPSTFWWGVETPTAKIVLGPCKGGQEYGAVCQQAFTDINIVQKWTFMYIALLLFFTILLFLLF